MIDPYPGNLEASGHAAHPVGAFHHRHLPASTGRLPRSGQPCRPRAQDDKIR
jgi:hypothetical protein